MACELLSPSKIFLSYFLTCFLPISCSSNLGSVTISIAALATNVWFVDGQHLSSGPPSLPSLQPKPEAWRESLALAYPHTSFSKAHGSGGRAASGVLRAKVSTGKAPLKQLLPSRRRASPFAAASMRCGCCHRVIAWEP